MKVENYNAQNVSGILDLYIAQLMKKIYVIQIVILVISRNISGVINAMIDISATLVV
jgi:hypothetical protein